MKKIIFIFALCMLLCGCGSKYQVSELEPTLFSKYYGMPQVKGTIKQIGDNSCDEVIITFEFSNGSIKDEGFTIVNNVEKNKLISFEETAYGASEIESEWLKYKLKVKNVECYGLKKDTNE